MDTDTTDSESPIAPPGQSGSGSGGGILPASSSGVALLGLLLFFLPWVNISCDSSAMNKRAEARTERFREPVYTQSGLDIALGQLRENPKFKQELESKLDPLRVTSSAGPEQVTNEIKDRSGEGQPLLLLFPVGLIGALVGGGVCLHQASKLAAWLMLGGALLALGVAVSTLSGEFPVETDSAFRPSPAQSASAPDLRHISLFVVSRTPIYWAEVVISCLLPFLSLGTLWHVRSRPRPSGRLIPDQVPM